MKLTFQLTPDDFVAFHEYHVTHSEDHKKFFRQLCFFSPTLLFALTSTLLLYKNYFTAGLFAIVAVISFFLTPPLLKKLYKKIFEMHVAKTTDDTHKEPITVELLEDGLHTSSCLEISTLKYTAIDQIIEDNGYTYIKVLKNKALILPHDKISPDELNAFVTEVQKRKAAASPPNDTSH